MTGLPVLEIHVDPQLQLFLPASRRGPVVEAPVDPAATLGHVVQSAGVPLTEVGPLRLDGSEVAPSARADRPGRLLLVPVQRPQPAPTDPPRFLLDVHLGALARRLWILGLDAEYRNDAADDELAEQAGKERRVLLTQDRGLLRRRNVAAGAYARGSRVSEQLDDVLDRFAPPLRPWTRCGACGGVLAPVAVDEVSHLLEPGTRRSYTDFARCQRCGTPFWRGAHARRLDAVVERAREVVARRRAGE